MLKGFKDFILRGNVIDLSVAVVMGAAFSAVVTAFTDKIIRPLLNAITPPSSPGFGVQLVGGKESTFVDFAALITATINFVMVAAVVYFVIVLPMRTLKERRKRGEESGPAEPTDVELLMEIRDLLKAQANGSGDLAVAAKAAKSTKSSGASGTSRSKSSGTAKTSRTTRSTKTAKASTATAESKEAESESKAAEAGSTESATEAASASTGKSGSN